MSRGSGGSQGYSESPAAFASWSFVHIVLLDGLSSLEGIEGVEGIYILGLLDLLELHLTTFKSDDKSPKKTTIVAISGPSFHIYFTAVL